ncbi:PAS domain S-box protein [bacterium]|nr:PAS domain S-box protein [bacterium]
MKQTQDGKIWFATRRGIVSYDGYNWDTYVPQDETANVSISRLLVDDLGAIYALNEFGRLYKYEGKRFEYKTRFSERVLNPRRIDIAAVASQGSQSDVAAVYVDTLYFYIDGEVRRPDYIHGGHRVITSMVAYKGLFLAGAVDGLHAFDRHEEVPLPADVHALNIPGLRGLYVEEIPDSYGATRDRIWFSSRDKVGYLEDGEVTVLASYNRFAFGDPSARIAMAPDGAGGVLAGTYIQLIHISADGDWRKMGVTSGLPTEGAYDLLLDREKNLWIASYRGATKIQGFWFENYYAVNGLYTDEVSAIAALPDGGMMLGHLAGISIWRKGTIQHAPFRNNGGGYPGSQARALDMAVDETRRCVWIATGQHGLLKMEYDGRYKRYAPPDDYLGVYSVYLKEDGTILTGTKNGLTKFDPVSETFELLDDIGHAYVRVIYSPPDEDNVYLCVAQRGVFKWDGKKTTPLPWDDNFGYRNVFNIIRTPWGEMYAGTTAGLVRVTTHGIEPVTIAGHTIDRPVYLFFIDGDQLWIGTDLGLFKTSGKDLRHYTIDEGLSGNELNRNSAAFGPRGRIWFGTSRGLTIYESRYDRSQYPALTVTIQGIEVAGVMYDVGTPIKLEPDHNDFILHYQAISFVHEEQIEFRYFLHRSGQRDPVEVRTLAHDIPFINLSPGTYQIEIQARHRNNDWGPVSSTSPITILPPIVDRLWFRFLGLAALFGVFLLIHRYLISRSLARQLRGEVASERSRLSQVVQSTRTLIVQANKNAIITYVNPSVLNILGYDPDEIVGKHYLRILFPEDRQAVSEIIRNQMQASKKTSTLQCRLVSKDGDVHWYGFTISLTQDAKGETVGMTAIGQDISERKDLEERLNQSQRMEAIGMLAGGVAHDFNNLLTAITGYTELAQFDSRDNPEMMDNLNEIEKATRSAAELTRQLLAFSRKQTLQPRLLNLNSVVLDRITMLKRLIGEDIRLEVDLADELWSVHADPGQIEQVIINLAVNARDAMPGGGWLTIHTRNRTILETSEKGIPPGEYVELDIKDTGTGIPPEMQERIFEPFFTTKEKGRGTGLGLATVYGIITQSDGYLKLESAEGEGSTFFILLPREVKALKNLDAVSTAGKVGGGSERILVVEDEDSVRSLATAVLRRRGYTVYEASNGEEALELIRVLDRPVHLMLTDVIMPKLNGPELAEKMLDIWPGTNIMFMSGYTASYIEDRGLLNRGYQLLVKPFRTEDLARRIREELDK